MARESRQIKHASFIIALGLAAMLAACGGGSESGSSGGSPGELVVYSGREEELIQPFLDEFEKKSGVEVKVRYADTPDLVATVLEEGERTRADVFVGQDAAGLDKLRREGLLAPYEGIARTPAEYRAADNTWTGLSGRVRVLIVGEGVESPDSVFDLVDPRFKGELAAPMASNVSFRDWVSAIRLERGDAFALRYLEGLKANEIEMLGGHGDVRKAVGEGEFNVGLVNHYYVELSRREGAPVRAVHTDQGRGEFGVPFNVASAGITKSAANEANARKLIDFLLTPEVQRRFAGQNFEYPLLDGLEPPPGVTPLDDVKLTDVPLSELAGGADGTDRLLDRVDLGS